MPDPKMNRCRLCGADMLGGADMRQLKLPGGGKPMKSCYDNTLLATEQRRCRYCRGCEYFEIIGLYGCCNYYLQTGNRRPCKFGLKDCSVRVCKKGFVPSDKHLAFCRKVDAEEQAEQARQAKRKDLSAKEPAQPILTEKELAAYDITEQDRKQGRPARSGPDKTKGEVKNDKMENQKAMVQEMPQSVVV